MSSSATGLISRTLDTDRLQVHLRQLDRADGVPVVFVHGNVSSSAFFEDTLLAMPEGWRPMAVDLRGFGGSEPLPIDATQGVRDWSEDLAATMRALSLTGAHWVGWSMGAGVLFQLLIDHPDLVHSLTLIAPVSPYGYGGTIDATGTRIEPAGSCSGAGCASPDFVAALAAGDRSDGPSSARTVFHSAYVGPGWSAGLEDRYLDAMLSTRTGPDHYPGDSVPADAWPGTLPGDRGVLNTLSPTHFDVTGIVDVEPKPPVLWVRGDVDAVVSDAAGLDVANLGALGVIPGWPGAQTHPAQPMVTQTRAVLETYAERGGSYREIVMPGVGHSPHLEKPLEFMVDLLEHLESASGRPALDPTPTGDGDGPGAADG